MNRQAQPQRKPAAPRIAPAPYRATRAKKSTRQDAAAPQPDEAVALVVATTRISWGPRFDQYLSLQSVIGVGHGYAALTRDGEPVFEENGKDFEELMTVADAEKLADQDPRHDWKIHLVAFLEDRHYRRTAAGCWELVRRGYGLS
jgi:hypothetical protein